MLPCEIYGAPDLVDTTTSLFLHIVFHLSPVGRQHGKEGKKAINKYFLFKHNVHIGRALWGCGGGICFSLLVFPHP